jgi:pyrroloquinoline quinone (PQQ) biosynthesis protein C
VSATMGAWTGQCAIETSKELVVTLEPTRGTLLAMHSTMAIVDVGDGWSAFIRPNWIDSLDRTPFLTRCREGIVTREELCSYVRQQCHYSRHFTRYLSALLSSIVDETDRRDLVQNLFEEMGLGAFGSVPHSQIYRDMMRTMGVSLADEAPSPETDELIATMFECSSSKRPMVGLGALCLGAEAIVPHLYSTIVHGFESIGEPTENLTFFHIHIEGDDEHAVTMRRIIVRELERHPESLVDLEYGAARAIAARIRFFEALSQRITLRRLEVA